MAALFTRKQYEQFQWTDIIHPDPEDLEGIAQEYSLDLYQIRDSLEAGHLPKIEKHENYTFLILRAYTGHQNRRYTSVNELSNKIAFFYNQHKIITIHRTEFPFLKNISQDFSHSEELLIFILREMVRTYDEPSETLSKKVDFIERTIFLKKNNRISLEDLYYLKSQTRISRNLLLLTQSVLTKADVEDARRTAMQDVKDQLVKLILTFEAVADDSDSLLRTYMSVIDQKRNEVMKLLTVFSAFFLPLTFIVGIYGMNFRNMPELEWPAGYYYTLAGMALISILIYLWFRKKGIL